MGRSQFHLPPVGDSTSPSHHLTISTATTTTTTTAMPWGSAAKEKKEEKEPNITEEEVLIYEINETTNDTLESTR